MGDTERSGDETAAGRRCGCGPSSRYTVKTPGSSTRGARRIITGQATDEDYYTADHYASFDLIDRTC